MSARTLSGRALGIAEIGLGAVLAVRSARVAAAAAGPGGQPAPGRLVAVLGLRSLAQGAVTAAVPRWSVLTGGALVDATHAASMLPVVAVSPKYRRAAAISAAVAALTAAAGTAAARAQLSGRGLTT